VRISRSNDKVPHRVNTFLLPDERSSARILHLHPARIIPSLVTAIGGLLAVVVISPAVQDNGALELTIWLLLAILVAELALAILDWFFRYLVITNSRLFICRGLLVPNIALSSPLPLIRDIRLTRSIGGRLLGYGTLVLESEHLAIDYVPYPEQIYTELLGLLFGKEDHGEEDHGEEDHGDDSTKSSL
jgi:hypothetical protein